MEPGTGEDDAVVAVTVSLGETGWDSLEPVRGGIIEVYLDDTNQSFATGGLVAAFLIVSVSVTPDRTCILEAKSLGTGNVAVDADLSSKFNRRRGTLHLCQSKPCTEAETDATLHVTKVRLWTVPWEEVTVLNGQQRRSVRKFLGLHGEVEEPGGETGNPIPEKVLKKPAGRRSVKPLKPAPKKKDRRGEDKEKGKKDKKDTKKDGEKKKKKAEAEDGVPSVSRAALKEKLARLRERLTGTRGLVEDAFAEEDEDGPEESVVPVDSESPQDELDTGTALVAKAAKKPKRKAEARDGAPRRTAAMRALEDTNVGSSKLPQAQLVQQALAVGSGSKKEKKQKEGQAAHELAKILTRTLKKKGKDKKDKKDKRWKKKKKKKKKKKGKGSSDPSSSSGVTSSSETSSDGSSNKGQQRTSSSEEEYEAPLRKRAKSKPGSILSLLVEHARDQLDQSSMVGLPERDGKSLTDGIKLTSYFQILFKSKLTGAMAQQREMYHVEAREAFGSGRRASSPIPMSSSECVGRKLDSCSSYGAVPAGRIFRRRYFHHIANQKARQAGCKSPGLGLGKLAWRLWTGSRWKRPLRPLWRRCHRLERRKEGQERKRKRQGSQQEQLVEPRCRSRQRRRVEGQARPEERQVTEAAEVGKLAVALEERWKEFYDPILIDPDQCLRRALDGCSSLRAVGLSLCWLIVAGGFYRGTDEKMKKFFSTLVRDLTVKQPTSGTRRVPGVFPLREGPLHALRSKLRSCSFEECTTNEFLVQSWAEEAWVYLCLVGSNILAGFPAALGLGRWSRLEADAAAAVRASVQRRLSRDVCITPDASGMDEELKNRHIGYAGDLGVTN